MAIQTWGHSEDEFQRMTAGMERKMTLRKGMNAESREENCEHDGLFVAIEPTLTYQGKTELGGHNDVALYRAVRMGRPCWLQVAIWRSKFPYSAYGRREYVLNLLEGEQIIRDHAEVA